MHRVDERAGKIKYFDQSVLDLPPLWLPFGLLWVQWQPFRAHRVDDGGGKDKNPTPVGARFAPPMAAIRPSVCTEQFGAHRVDEGVGKIKIPGSRLCVVGCV